MTQEEQKTGWAWRILRVLLIVVLGCFVFMGLVLGACFLVAITW